MINKIWKLTFLISLGCLVSFTNLSQPSIAMENNDDNIYKSPSKSKTNFEDEEYNKAISVLNKREKKYKKLQEENNNLRHAIRETDGLVTGILNSSVTTFSYLSAVAKRASNEELNRLFIDATNDLVIPSIITGGHTKFDKEAPKSHIKLLEVTKLLEHTNISHDYATIQYRTLTIEGTSEKKVTNSAKKLQKVMQRDNVKKREGSLFEDSKEDKKTEPLKKEEEEIRHQDDQISENEDIQSVIQENAKELGINLNPKGNK
jgi:hypothetical protein